MLRRLALATLLVLMPLAGAEALTCTNYPFTLTNGTLADANQVMANFNAILNCVNTSLAPINNPTFTGTVTATTISVGTLTVNTSLIVPGTISFSSPLSPANGGTGLTTYGALTNQQTAISGATTILNASKGQTINAGGNAFYTIGLNAASGYDADFQVTIVNNDTGRGKRISPNGATSFIMWPGQRVICMNVATAWVCPLPGRWQKTGAQFFVDTGSGADTNDCLASGSGACKTIGHAVALMKANVDAVNGEPTINCASGTYVENVTTQGQQTGVNVWELTGTTAGGCNIQLSTSGAGLLVSDNDEVQISNVNFSNAGAVSNAFAFATHQTGIIDVLAGVTVSGGTFADVYECDTLGQVNFTQNMTISSNHTTTFSLGPRCGMLAGGMSFVWGSSPTISGNIIQLTGAATASFSSVGFSGTLTCNQQWAVTGNSFLSLGGTTVSSCTNPGSPAAGSSPFGGQVSP